MEEFRDLEQIARIKEMEEAFDEAQDALGFFWDAIERYDEALPHIAKLMDYYTSGQWKKDFEDDSNGKIPSFIKRGVLSEDGIYNMILERADLFDELSELIDDE